MHLLMELQSFSRATEFRLYVSNQKHVRKVMRRLEHELPKTLPAVHIDLTKIYQGGGGAWDAWNTYSDELASSHRANQPGATGKLPGVDAASYQILKTGIELPPPYDQVLAQPSGTSRRLSTPPSLKRLCQDDPSANKRARGVECEWYEANYPLGSPTEENTPTSTRGRLSQHSTGDSRLIQERQPMSSPLLSNSFRDQSTQGNSSPPDFQLTPTRPPVIGHNNSNDSKGMQAPPYAASVASTASLDRDIKPTIFTAKPQVQPQSTITLTLTDIERLIARTIQAQVPAIAAQVQHRNLATELTAWAQPSIADYIDNHMPAIMHEAVSAHVSDVNDEFECAAASLHETKDEALTEIRSAEKAGVEEVHRESQAATDDLQEQSRKLSEALEDKFTEFEDRFDAKMSPCATPSSSRHLSVAGNSVKEAVRVFERFHRSRLTPEEQVKVLLSIAQFNNAEVFVAADLESRKMLVAHWSGKNNCTPPSPPIR